MKIGRLYCDRLWNEQDLHIQIISIQNPELEHQFLKSVVNIKLSLATRQDINIITVF